MNSYLDSAEPALVQDMEHISVLFDKLYLLAGRLSCMTEVARTSGEFLSIYRELQPINEQLQQYDYMQFIFSGRGFVPATIPSGEVNTVCQNVSHVTGMFLSAEIAAEHTIDYMDKEDFADDELYDGNLLTEDIDTVEFLGSLVEPELGQRIYVEFLSYSGDSEARHIGGSAVRAVEVEYVHIMDLANLTIEAVERIPDTNSLVDDTEVNKHINGSSQKLNKLLSDPAFREKESIEQIQLIGHILDGLNKRLNLDRFACSVEPEFVYVHSIKDGKRTLAEVPVDSFIDTIHMQPVGIDSLELFKLSEGKPIFSQSCLIDPNAGICLVGEIDEDTQHELAIDSKIIWVPVSSQDVLARFEYFD